MDIIFRQLRCSANGYYLGVVDWERKCSAARGRNGRPLVSAHSITRPFMRTLGEMLGLSAERGWSLLAGFAVNTFGRLSVLQYNYPLALMSMQAETSFSERAAHHDGLSRKGFSERHEAPLCILKALIIHCFLPSLQVRASLFRMSSP